jgi:hypothetical protein
MSLVATEIRVIFVLRNRLLNASFYISQISVFVSVFTL